VLAVDAQDHPAPGSLSPVHSHRGLLGPIVGRFHLIELLVGNPYRQRTLDLILDGLCGLPDLVLLAQLLILFTAERVSGVI
jgi:hypothetical protein